MQKPDANTSALVYVCVDQRRRTGSKHIVTHTDIHVILVDIHFCAFNTFLISNSPGSISIIFTV